jgi:CRP/FNR family transcriptional regulator/CRP/FNR family cyclic AMP-dependent transcriptional regulator
MSVGMEDYEQILAVLPLLARLPESDLRELASLGRLRKYADGTVVFRQGDQGDSMHVIIDGSVRINVISADGEEATVALLGRGECLGELALLDRSPRSGTAVAAGAARTFVVGREDFIEWLSQYPQAALALLENMSRRFRRKDQALLDMVFLNLPERVAKRLFDLAASQIGARPDTTVSGPIRLRITQGQLASMLAISRQAVNKELNALALKGWITLGRGSIILNDVAAIQLFAVEGEVSFPERKLHGQIARQ